MGHKSGLNPVPYFFSCEFTPCVDGRGRSPQKLKQNAEEWYRF